MYNKFPCPICNENDLDIYEENLYTCKKDDNNYEMKIENKKEDENIPSLSNNAFLPCYLKKHIGKLVRVESLICNGLESRIGTLLEIGADYIVIKLYQDTSTMVCDMNSIRYITIVHDNDKNKISLY